MFIRKATKEETDTILDLSQKFVGESSMGYVKPSLRNISKEMFGPHLESGAAYYLLAEKKNTLLGWILVGVNIDPYSHEEVGCLLDIYVFPEYRKSGVAKKLMHEALDRLKQAHYKKVKCSIFSGNHSKALCDQFGFKEVLTVFERPL
ncbi:L-amino acid N-acyltransferase YncA [Evansella vedderi]|uniref:L-amino acid N-acyltransferase YncA n=1 Tax=Evansella vedderi TaxID=38282 RepID=A0ABU0A284_9BACI|nr:GNAT family N-acetyltransferase [Evansella vedderi]MDQ0257597.1 L-amino acid N-acyltransferase YncA [Evansella vedderi]